MNLRHRNVLRYGSPDDLPEAVPLRAGPLTAIYLAGDLRYLCVGEHEVLRRVYVAVRDRNWRTIPAELSEVAIEQGNDAFEIRYQALHQEGEICFRWNALIQGSPEGTVRFIMDGAACSTFLRNRIGICVLHPAEACAGAPCRVTHTDGSVTEGALPHYISPHQPFKEIRAIAHQVAPGLWAEVQFEGEVFEMEDQRNWTDASFKTYSTPLELPFPVRIEAGTPVRQAVTIALRGRLPRSPRRQPSQKTVLTLGDMARSKRPPLGLGMASHGQPLDELELQRLRALQLEHLRVDLPAAGWSALLAQADEQASALRAGLEIALPLALHDANALAQLADQAKRLAAPVQRWLLLTDGVPSAQLAGAIARARGVLAPAAPKAAFAVGVNAYFTELNRTRPPLERADLVCYSLNPQVHAFDNLSLVETLPMQAVTVESACQFIGERGVVVSPVTLRPRFNPSATGPEAALAPDALPPSVDVRQMSLLGAGWTLVSLKHLMSHLAIHSLTYYETTGWRGVMERPEGSPTPAFPSRPGEVFPLYHVLRWVGMHPCAGLRALHSSAPRQVDGMALQSPRGLCIALANLTHEPQRVELADVSATLHAHVLDDNNAEAAMRDPGGWAVDPGTRLLAEHGSLGLTLPPYAVAWLESEAR